MPTKTDHKKQVNRLLILGWDAADWMMIDPLIAKGKMPHLQHLLEHGIRANLGTLEPKLSPLLWSSITTGKTADKHGILNFVEPQPDGSGLRISRSTTRKTKALWNIATQSGYRCNVTGWYASHPAEPINGNIISNVLAESITGKGVPLQPGTVHPTSLSDKIASHLQYPDNFPEDLLHFLIPKHREIKNNDERIIQLKKLMSYAISIENCALTTLEESSWDLSMVFFDAIDAMGHHFMQFRLPCMSHISNKESRWFADVMDRVYEWHDQSLGRILKASGENTTVILLSDHGFHIGAMRPILHDLTPEKRMEKEASWHRPFGVLVASGPGVNKNSQVAPCTILDIVPTSLRLLGLPVGDDMDGRTLTEILDVNTPKNTIASWDTKPGDAGLHPEDMRQDPSESAASLQQLIDLGYLAALPKDISAQLDLVRRESSFNLGVALMSIKKYKEAAPHFRTLLDEQPYNTRFAVCLSQCYLGMNDNKARVELLRSITSRVSNHAETMLTLAQALAMEGELDESIKIYQQTILKADPKVDLSLNLAFTALMQDRYNEAYVQIQLAIAKNPTDPISHITSSKIELFRGHFEEAAAHALDALELTQAIPEAHYILGAALAWYGDEESAKKSFEFAAAYDKENPTIPLFQLALAQKSRNKNEIQYFQRKYEEACRLTEIIRQKEAPFGPEVFARKFSLKLFN